MHGKTGDLSGYSARPSGSSAGTTAGHRSICNAATAESTGLNVAVIGQGPMGQLWNCTLKQLGARQIVGVDLNAERLKVSPQMGATDTLQVSADQTDEDISQKFKVLGGQRPDLVIECVGHREQVVNLCLEICKEHGSVFFFGVPTQALQQISLFKLFWKNITLYASVVPDFEIDF